jgi:hypothetical protein
MNFEARHTVADDTIHFNGSISMGEILRLRMSPFDRMVVESNPTSASHHLMILQLLFYLEEERLKNEYTSIDRPVAQEHHGTAQPA